MLLFYEEDSMGRRAYPAELRRRALDLIAAGRRVADVARDLGISDQTLYDWRRKAHVDRASSPASPQANARSWWQRVAGSESWRTS